MSGYVGRKPILDKERSIEEGRADYVEGGVENDDPRAVALKELEEIRRSYPEEVDQDFVEGIIAGALDAASRDSYVDSRTGKLTGLTSGVLTDVMRVVRSDGRIDGGAIGYLDSHGVDMGLSEDDLNYYKTDENDEIVVGDDGAIELDMTPEQIELANQVTREIDVLWDEYCRRYDLQNQARKDKSIGLGLINDIW